MKMEKKDILLKDILLIRLESVFAQTILTFLNLFPNVPARYLSMNIELVFGRFFIRTDGFTNYGHCMQ